MLGSYVRGNYRREANTTITYKYYNNIPKIYLNLCGRKNKTMDKNSSIFRTGFALASQLVTWPVAKKTLSATSKG